MLNIIRNCSHFSDVYTGFITDSNGLPLSVVRKAFSKSGVSALLREFEGISGYCKSLGIDSKNNILDFRYYDSYGRLELKYHDGTPGNYMAPIDKNRRKIDNLIEYYRTFFYMGKESFCHGDFSISNVLFEKDSVKWIIDWENVNNIMPREYDLVYCITENCLSRFAKNNRLTKTEISVYSDQLQKINKLIGVDELIMKGPAHWCRDMAIYYIKKTGVGHNKCLFIAYDKEIINNLDRILVG